MKKYKVKTTISYPVKGATGKTGNWRVFKPILDKEKCVKCLRCWIFCPEATVIRNKDNSIDIMIIVKVVVFVQMYVKFELFR